MRLHGGVPVSSTVSIAEAPEQIDCVPLSVAVGKPSVTVTERVACGLVQPFVVSVTESVRIPAAPAVKVMLEVVLEEVMVPPVIPQR